MYLPSQQGPVLKGREQQAENALPFVDRIIRTVVGFAGCMVSFFLIESFRLRQFSCQAPSSRVNPAMAFADIGPCMVCIATLIYTVAPNSPSAGKCLVSFVFIYSAVLAGTITPYAFAVGREARSKTLCIHSRSLVRLLVLRDDVGCCIHSPVLYQPRQAQLGSENAWLWFPFNPPMEFSWSSFRRRRKTEPWKKLTRCSR